jgi:agmatine deiminase
MILSQETDQVYFSAHLKNDYSVFFERMKMTLEKYDIGVKLLQDTEDYWCRDYMPIQIGKDIFVKYGYSPDYINKPTKVQFITDVNKPWSKLQMEGKSLIDMSDITLDGGNVIKTPYHVIMTEKIFTTNSNIKPNTLISRLEETFQTEVLIVPWYKSQDVCGHTDGMVRYIKDRELLMDNYERFAIRTGKRIHKALEDKGYTVHELELPYAYDHSWAYINFLQTSKVIIMPKFGLTIDKYAYNHICSLFDVPVVQISAPSIIKKYGGAFNCMSWNIKR